MNVDVEEEEDAAQDQRERCWALIAGYLCGRDLLALAFCSASTLSSLSSTPGLWQRACAVLLPGWARGHAQQQQQGCSSARLVPQQGAASDRQAQQVLMAAAALAHNIRHAPSVAPQPVHIPPWLPAQPGRARGFVRADQLLALTATQLHLLTFGGLSGHTSGVFTSSCASSPRSQAPCACLAAVVVNKTLVAELYVPRQTSLLDPWVGILNPPTQPHTAPSCSSSSTQAAGCAAGAPPQAPHTAAPVQCELWLSTAVSLQPPPAGTEEDGQQEAGAAAGRGGRRGAREAGSRRRAKAGAGPGCDGVTWAQVQELIMECIGGNAGRCRAVLGTTVLAPGTPAAADVEVRLQQLAAAGAPVLDLRRLRHEARHAATGAPGAALQLQLQLPYGAGAGVADGDGKAVRQRHHHQQQQQPNHKQQQQQQQQQQPQPQPQQQLPALAVAQAALSHILADKHKAARGRVPAGGDPTEDDSSDDARAEATAALVAKLPQLVPGLEVLVLPVLLPGGRAARRLPGSGKVSAPRLLCLNVPCLMAARVSWEALPQLRAVLLMVGPPPPLPRPAGSCAGGSSQACCGSNPGACREGCASCGGKPASNRGVAPAATSLQSGPGQLVKGTYTLAALEQQLEQQAQLQQQQQHAPPPQPTWDQEQEDAWVQQQLDEQQQQQQLAGSSSSSGGRRWQQQQQQGACSAGHEGAGCSVVGPLPRSAVEALLDMVLSCMDRGL